MPSCYPGNIIRALLCIQLFVHSIRVEHIAVHCTPLPAPKFHSFHRLHFLDIDSFASDLQSFTRVILHLQALYSVLICYNNLSPVYWTACPSQHQILEMCN